MKLRNIIENEYSGLEDNDEFHSDVCMYCDGPIDNEPVECSHCGDPVISDSSCAGCASKAHVVCNRCWEIYHPILNKTGIIGFKWGDKITESEYAGLEDADEFEDWPDVYDREMDNFGVDFSRYLNNNKKIPANFSDGDGIQWQAFNFRGGPIWSEKYQGFQFKHRFAPDLQGLVSYNLAGTWDYEWDIFYLMKLSNITESEYAGLEDADEFGGDVEFMGEAHLGPHIFRVWYHKRLDRIAVDVNGYEFGFEDSHMPIAQMEAITKKFIELRPDLLPHVMRGGNNSPVSQIMDIGLALVQDQ